LAADYPDKASVEAVDNKAADSTVSDMDADLNPWTCFLLSYYIGEAECLCPTIIEGGREQFVPKKALCS
jgi:hypothetical protein